MDTNFATKIDLKELDLKTQSEFKSLRSEIKVLEYKLIIKIIGVLLALEIALIAYLTKS